MFVRQPGVRVCVRCVSGRLVSRVLPFLVVVDVSLRSPLTLSSHPLSRCSRSPLCNLPFRSPLSLCSHSLSPPLAVPIPLDTVRLSVARPPTPTLTSTSWHPTRLTDVGQERVASVATSVG
ncbi:hypothetical protein BDW22DRAFT_1364683 [Trametopsis cervina]|nr:hypothetical protein BDW22DRAFT_1364683 [Trametopsis cervina]